MRLFRNRVVLGVLALAAGLSCETAAKIAVGDAVSFRARLADGTVFSTDDLRGRTVVLHFWLGAHEGSVLQLDNLRNTLDAYGDRGVVLLGVCLDAGRRDAREAIDRFARGRGWYHTLNFMSAPTIDQRFYDAAYGIPTCWVVGPDGTALWTGHPSELSAVMVGLLEDHPPTETGPAPVFGVIPDDQMQPPMAVAPEARTDVVSAAIAIRDSLMSEPPDFAGLLRAGAQIPESAYHDPIIVVLTRKVNAYLKTADAETFAAFEAARAADPESAKAARALLDAVQRTDLASLTVAPELLQRKLDMIERNLARGRDGQAYDDMMWVATHAAGNVEAGGTVESFATYLTDASFQAGYRAAAEEKEAGSMLMIAEGHVRGYQEEKAVALLRELLATYPDSEAATKARALLTELE